MARFRAVLPLLLLAACLQAARSSVVIEDATRKIDISTFRARHQSTLTIRNDGTSPLDAVELCESSGQLDHAALLEASIGGTKLQWTPASAPRGAPSGVACRRFQLTSPLAPGAKTSLATDAIFTHVLRPEPASIKQSEPQRVVYEGSATLASPYAVEKQSTEVVLGTNAVASFSEVPPSSKSGSSLKYGPYKDTPPLTLKPITVHYENSAPFARVSELEREVEVSHWGNAYFEERYNLVHAGARISGEWSRYDLMTRPAEFGRAAIAQVVARLPPSAHSLYYRDAIGNISSSDTRFGVDAVAVQLRPRYPLFGGWSATFLFGWSLPLRDVVRKGPSGRLVFEAPMGPAIQGLVVDNLIVKVVLPEGVSRVQVVSSLPLNSEPRLETKYTYLDVMGRTVVVLHATNVVDELTTPLRIEYSYSSLGLLQKPLLLAVAFGVLFAASIVLNRSSAGLRLSASAQNVVKAHAS